MRKSIEQMITEDLSNHQYKVELDDRFNNRSIVIFCQYNNRKQDPNGWMKLMIEYNKLIVTGDYGDAIYQWSEPITWEWLSKLDIQYFSRKCIASETGRQYLSWDEEKAKRFVLERLFDFAEGIYNENDHEDEWDTLPDEKKIKFVDKYLKEYGSDCTREEILEWTDHKERFSYELHNFEYCDEIFGDCDGFYECGDAPDHRCYLHLAACVKLYELMQENAKKNPVKHETEGLRNYNFNFVVTGELVDTNNIINTIQKLESPSLQLKSVEYTTSRNLEREFNDVWQQFIVKKSTETEVEYNERMKEAKNDLKEYLRRPVPDYSFMIMTLRILNIEPPTEEQLDRINNPEKYWRRVRIIEYPGLDVCKKMMNDNAVASNNCGPVDRLESLTTDEQWYIESKQFIKQLECEEFEETFNLLINYFKYNLVWQNI